MNCGLSNLDTLRKHLLAGSLGAETKFDTVLQTIGQAVAGLFNTHTNRKLAYLADDVTIIRGDRELTVLQRYPVVEVASVETRYSNAEGWQIVPDEPFTLVEDSGMVQFVTPLGDNRTQIRIIWSGGYWFNHLEPDEDGYPETLPEGLTELPSDLLAAFLIQCEQAWQVHDKLGTGLVGGDGAQFLNTKLSTLDLVPQVKQMLAGYIRYAL